MELDFCENLSKKIRFKEHSAGEFFLVQRLYLWLDGLLLSRFHKKFKFRKFGKVFVISSHEKRQPVEHSEVLSPKIDLRKRKKTQSKRSSENIFFGAYRLRAKPTWALRFIKVLEKIWRKNRITYCG